jgi:hypothetical protein
MKRFVWIVVGAVAACGGSQRGGGGDDENASFECGGRRAEYMMSGGMMYPEQGVRMKCDGDIPLVEEYFTSDDGSEKKRSARIPVAAWEASWKDFDNSGWERLEDCTNKAVKEKDPIYTFEIADEDRTVSFRCQGDPLPYPFDVVVSSLDRAKGNLPVEE